MPAIDQLYRVLLSRSSSLWAVHRRLLGPFRRSGVNAEEAGGIVTLAMSTDPRFAEPTPFARLVYAHAVSVAGDACLTVSLAGSLFFQNPAGAAREKVLLYLILTMAPFAIVAPVLGPMLDRSRGGRRMLVIVSALGRAVICLAMAQYVSKAAPEGLLIYPLAFGALVLAKGYTIAKSALVPAVVHDKAELVNANSRLALLSVIAATVGGVPAAGVQHLFGADWSLRMARGRVRGGRDPGVQDTEGGRPRSGGQQGRRTCRSRAPPTEHPARRERDGGAPQQRGLPRVLHCVHAERRSLRVSAPRSPRPRSADSSAWSRRRSRAKPNARR